MLNLATTWLLAFTDAGETNGTGSVLGLLLPLVIIGGLFYFMLIMPQRRRMKAMDHMRQELGIGDDVRTIGGIHGTVVAMSDDEVTIDVGGGTTLRLTKRAVAERLGGEPT